MLETYTHRETIELLSCIKDDYESLIEEKTKLLNETKVRLSELSELHEEIKAIEESVRMGLLKNFKIKRVMVPSDFDNIDDMITEIERLEELVVETEEYLSASPKDALFKCKSCKSYPLIFDMLPSPFAKQLLGYTDGSNKHFKMVLTKSKLIVQPISMLANILNNFSSFSYMNDGCVEEYGLKRFTASKLVTSSFDETMSNIKTHLSNFEETMSEYLYDRDEYIFLADLYLSKIDSVTEEELLDYSKAAHECTRQAPNPFYSKYLDDIDEANGIDLSQESKLLRQIRRSKSKVNYTDELVDFIINYKK